MPAQAIDYIGIDISQDRLDWNVSEAHWGEESNDAQGRLRLIKKLQRWPHPRVICEYSGGYERQLITELLSANIEVCAVQPGRVRAWAQAEGLSAKTDRLDAALLRRFGEKVPLRLAEPTSPSAQVLRDLVDHRRQLLTHLVEVEGRIRLAGATLRRLLERERQFFKAEIARVDKQIKTHMDEDPDLKNKAERLQQLQGVGPVLSATILAYVPELGKIESAQLSALIGVAPHPKDSGKNKRPRHVRGGRMAVRNVLYMAAVSASHSNPFLAQFYQRLRAKGKPANVCLVAVMRRMLCVMNKLIAQPDFCLA
jgi:transposase